VGERTRLSAGSRLNLLAAAGTLAAVALAGFGLGTANAIHDSQIRMDRMATLDQSTLKLDDLNKSLLADVLSWTSADGGVHRTTEPDLSDLRRLATAYPKQDVSGMWAAQVATLAAREMDYAILINQQLPGEDDALPKILHTELDLSERLGKMRESIATQTARTRTQVDVVGRSARQRFLLTAALAGLLLGVGAWWTRHCLLTSLARIARVADAVAQGDFTARNVSTERGEVGDLAVVVDRMAETLENVFRRLEVTAERQDFAGRVDRAMQRVDTETELSELMSRVLATVDPGLPAELLVADSSESHMTVLGVNAGAGGCGCQVSSPWACTAVRTSQVLVQASGRELDACPRLRERQDGALSAVCLPVSFMGRSIGVLHAAREGEPPNPVLRERLSIVAERVGARLGTLRAMAKVEVQAATDSLTGLLNRRAFDDAVRALASSGRDYGLLMVDLDHFKRLNDVHGHASGDEALRRFADLIRGLLRRIDVPGRFGGEEFMISLPGTDLDGALKVAEQIRAALASGAAGPGVPACTASFGVTHSSCATTLADQLKIADAALMAAKRAGRNRCLAARSESGPWISPREEGTDGASEETLSRTGRHRGRVPGPRRPAPEAFPGEDPHGERLGSGPATGNREE
jgi:diguanylate cyclase (GGDEF)-like protein